MTDKVQLLFAIASTEGAGWIAWTAMQGRPQSKGDMQKDHIDEQLVHKALSDKNENFTLAFACRQNCTLMPCLQMWLPWKDKKLSTVCSVKEKNNGGLEGHAGDQHGLQRRSRSGSRT